MMIRMHLVDILHSLNFLFCEFAFSFVFLRTLLSIQKLFSVLVDLQFSDNDLGRINTNATRSKKWYQKIGDKFVGARRRQETRPKDDGAPKQNT